MGIRILDYSPKYASTFEKLNKEWLEKYFVIEDVDYKLFKDPYKGIIQKPGFILFAQVSNLIVGTGAIVKIGEKWELTKLAVTEHYQSQGIGQLLVTQLIGRAKKSGAKTVFIVTNTILDKAIGLYKKLGFKVIHEGEHPKYQRGNIVFELSIDKTFSLKSYSQD